MPPRNRERRRSSWSSTELKIPETSLARTLDLCGLEEEASYAFEPFYKKHKKDNAAALAFALLCSDADRTRDARGALARRFGPIEVSPKAPRFLLRALYTAPGLGLVRKTAGEAVVPVPLLLALIRNESGFDEDSFSPAGAVGLMQMLPSTARHTAAAAHVGYDPRRLMTEPAYNAQLGASFLGELLGSEKGSYILTLAAYNAGPGRAAQWINAYGDPRHDNVDPIDWVERIPIAETRNYVQRVMENFVVYRAKFGEQNTKAPQVELAHAGGAL